MVHVACLGRVEALWGLTLFQSGGFSEVLNGKIKGICFRNSYFVIFLLVLDNMLFSLMSSLVCNLQMGPKSDKLANLL